MFEGNNEIKFSKVTAQKIVGEYLTKLFGVPIEVTALESGNYSSTIDVTFNEMPEVKTVPATQNNT